MANLKEARSQEDESLPDKSRSMEPVIMFHSTGIKIVASLSTKKGS